MAYGAWCVVHGAWCMGGVCVGVGGHVERGDCAAVVAVVVIVVVGSRLWAHDGAVQRAAATYSKAFRVKHHAMQIHSPALWSTCRPCSTV